MARYCKNRGVDINRRMEYEENRKNNLNGDGGLICCGNY